MLEMIVTIVAAILVAAAGLYFCWRRELRYLQYFQQEDYEGKRFLDWCKRNSVFDTRGSLVAIVAITAIAACSLIGHTWTVLVSSICAAYLVYKAALEENPLTTGKLRLKLTERATRIFDTSQSINALAQLAGTAL